MRAALLPRCLKLCPGLQAGRWTLGPKAARSGGSALEHQNLCKAYIARNEVMLAMRHSSRALHFAPNTPSVVFQQADLLFALGNYSDAMERYREGLRLAPSWHQAWAQVARLYAQRREMAGFPSGPTFTSRMTTGRPRFRASSINSWVPPAPPCCSPRTRQINRSLTRTISSTELRAPWHVGLTGADYAVDVSDF